MNTAGPVVLKGGWDSTFKTCYVRITSHEISYEQALNGNRKEKYHKASVDGPRPSMVFRQTKQCKRMA